MKSGHLQTFKSFFPITGKCRHDRHTGLELLESKWQDWPCNSIACEVDHIDRNKAAESHLSCRNGFLEKWKKRFQPGQTPELSNDSLFAAYFCQRHLNHPKTNRDRKRTCHKKKSCISLHQTYWIFTAQTTRIFDLLMIQSLGHQTSHALLSAWPAKDPEAERKAAGKAPHSASSTRPTEPNIALNE